MPRMATAGRHGIMARSNAVKEGECHLAEIASKIVGRKRISRPYFIVRLGYIKTCAATDIHSTQYL